MAAHGLPDVPVPSSTYRLQVTADFPLQHAEDITGYLAQLGVGAVYVSPLLQSTTGSQHGYDVVDHTVIDKDRGGDAGLAALAQACAAAGLELVVDIVPNHMGVADPAQNAAWWDVLRQGRDAEHASWFDIDWQVHAGRVLLPVLGDDADPATDLRIIDSTSAGVAPRLAYFEHEFPIAEQTYSPGDNPAAVHARQHYELVNFRRADTDLNYRRFFAVTELAGLRVEDSAVFDATHAEILRWITDYGVTGLRIDHPDGLLDPEGYLRRLAEAAPQTWITVEKITEPGETLPASWPVAGMTGYDALAEVNALLIDPAAEAAMTETYHRLSGDDRSWADQVADGKQMIATGILNAEIQRLARLAPRIDGAAEALAELVVAFPVYRSYLPLGEEHLDEAIETAQGRRPDLVEAIDALTPRLLDPHDELGARFQQVTGAVMAKGVEDTAYYRYTRFIGLNEVGADPGTFGSTVDAFHAAAQRRHRDTPSGMTTLSTHDTKRGEDIRARLAVLAELPEQWARTVTTLLDLAPVPNRAFGYLMWQTIVATGFIDADRMHAYVEKAMREAADGTGWIDTNPAFEDSVHAAVDAAYHDPTVRDLIAELHQAIMPSGWTNGLSQKLVQLTMPGVPDVYQGSELWEDSLVDPDNRRPVNYALRARLLDELLAAGDPPPLDDSARAKLWLVANALRLRRDRAELFTDYQPITATGPLHKHLVAFNRGGAITLATRLPVGLAAAGGWADTTITLPDTAWTDVLSGDSYVGGLTRLDELFATYPVALLIEEPR